MIGDDGRTEQGGTRGESGMKRGWGRVVEMGIVTGWTERDWGMGWGVGSEEMKQRSRKEKRTSLTFS